MRKCNIDILEVKICYVVGSWQALGYEMYGILLELMKSVLSFLSLPVQRQLNVKSLAYFDNQRELNSEAT